MKQFLIITIIVLIRHLSISQCVNHVNTNPPFANNDFLPTALGGFNAYVDPHFTTNLSSNSIDNEIYYPIYNTNTYPHFYIFGESYPDSIPNLDSTVGMISFSSPFVPLNAFKPSVFELGVKHQFSQINNSVSPSVSNYSDFEDNFASLNEFSFDVYLKIGLNARYSTINQDGLPNEFDYLYTIKIPDSMLFLNPNFTPIENLNGSSQDFGQWNDYLTLEQTHFDGTDIEGCKLQDETYTCWARYDVLITGDLTTDGIHEVFIKAGSIIEVEPEAFIEPEITLMIESFFDFSEPMPMQTPEQVEVFCSQGKYKGSSLERSIAAHLDSLAQANPKPQPEPEPLEFSIFPNPTNGSAQAFVTLPEMATVSITVIDITGKVIGEPMQNSVLDSGRNFQNLQTEGLSPGVYFVHLVVNGEKYVERLVKR
jgi:hypothetical protein